ncbi:MAG: ShlB/FhaC/HecB family hemolysin secretion/activation protein [Cypionkella sp.]
MPDRTTVSSPSIAVIVPVLCATLAFAASGTAVQAQAVEQHPAPVIHGPQIASISTQALETRLTDGTPFGVNLNGLLVVDSHANGAKARAKTGAGINTSLAGPTAQNPDFNALLQKYIGQPLSYKMIGAIEAEVTRFYRDHGRSLVLVTVPPQEITSGVVQLNVNTFVLEKTAVEGANGKAQGYVASQIRVKPGQEVNTTTLLEDVNWLNLNPFRHVAVVFEPGVAADSTTLTLQVQNGRPWSAYAGIANSGTSDTGLARVYGGFNISALPWQDQQLSYQFTAAPDNISHGNLWNAGKSKGYVTHALSYFVPLTFSNGLRMKATVGLNHISSYSDPGGIFTALTTTNGATGEVSFPLPRTSGTWTLVPEVFLGWAADSYDRTQFGAGAAISREKTRLAHLELGLRSALNGKVFGHPSHGNFEVSLTTGRQSSDVTVGAVTTTAKPDYTYAKASISQEIALEQDRLVALRFDAQYSPDALHSLEEASLGGDGTVRGYPTSTISSQSAASLSLEYRLTSIRIPMGKVTGRLRPHVFADFGVADKTATSDVVHMSSVGLGAQFDVGENLIAKIDVAQALDTAGETKSGSTWVGFQLTARF